jgi:raffinose/stachyose/melibiose transport system permease protein
MQLSKTKTTAGVKSAGIRGERRTEARWCYLMLALPIIGFLVFSVYPILWTFRWSFFSYQGIKSTAAFVGLQNFKSLFTTDLTYWKTWITTIEFAVCKVPLELILAMLLALILTKDIKGKGFFRSAYYMPNVLSVAIIGVIMSNLFGYYGIINYALAKLGIVKEGIDWFATKPTSMAVLVIGSIWNTFGTNVLYFMAALSNVPKDVYESAAIDGANGVQQFFKITLPLIIPVGKIILLLSIIGTLGVNEYILVVANGAPAGETNTVMSYMTSQFVPGFAGANPPIGYGCAMGLITSVLFVFIALMQNKLNKKMDNIS